MHKAYALVLGKLGYIFAKKQKAKIKASLDMYFINKDKAYKSKLCKGIFNEYASFFFDVLDSFKSPIRRVKTKFDCKDFAIIDECLKQNKNVIIHCAYFGNFIALQHALSLKYEGVILQKSKLESTQLNSLLDECKAQFGAQVLDDKSLIKAFNNTKKNKILAMFCDIAKKSASKDSIDLNGVQIFLDEKLARLVKNKKAVIVPTFAYRKKNKYIIKCFKPLNCLKCDSLGISSYLFSCIKEMIVKYPKQYFFFNECLNPNFGVTNEKG